MLDTATIQLVNNSILPTASSSPPASMLAVEETSIVAIISQQSPTARTPVLDVKPEIYDITVLHYVLFAFEAGEAFFAGGLS